MTVVYHPFVQKEASAILRRYDRVNPKLGDAEGFKVNQPSASRRDMGRETVLR